MTPDLVIVGLSLSSAWGNGHATTYRALLRGLSALGQSVLFLERDVPWYADHRDLPDPDFCTLAFYESPEDLERRFGEVIARAPHTIVGSYVPDGVAVIDMVTRLRNGATHFYDIDTPVTLAKLEAGDEEYLAARQIPRFDTYFSFSGGPVLDRLERAFGARAARALYCSVDPERYRPTGAPMRWAMGYLGTYSPDRQPTLERLLLDPARQMPDSRFVVAGPQYPDTIAWPANVERIAHLPPAEHADFYSAQRFTLNVTRRDMIAAGHSPSVRLFEAAACGVPVISDRWDGLSEIFPQGEGLVIADRAEDVVDALASPEPADRDARAQALRRFATAHHSGRSRAQTLLSHLQASRADRARTAEFMDS